MKILLAITMSVSRLMYTIAGIALVGSMFLTCADVILRRFEHPIKGTYELVGILGAILVGFAIPQTTRVQGHVLMDFVTSKVPGWLQSFLRVLTRVMAIVLFIIIGWNLWILGADFKKAGQVSLTLHLPFYPVAWGLAVCSLFECLVLFADLFEKKESEP